MAVRPFLNKHGDLTLAVVLGAAMSIELLIRGDANLAVSIPAGAFACLSLSLRRSFPLAGFLLTWTGIAGLSWAVPSWHESSVVVLFVFFISLYSLGAHAAGPEMGLGAFLVLVGIVLFVMNDGDPFAPGDVVFGTALVGGPWGAGLAIKLRRDYEGLLITENRQLLLTQEERARRAVANERARIARELHDVVSHAISVTVLQARGGRKMLGVDDDEVRRSLDAIEHTNAQALSDMRRLLFLLRDTDDDPTSGPQPSMERLGSLVGQATASGLPVELEVNGASSAAPPGVDLSAYRIIQESLTNVLKHAGPEATARITVRYGVEDLEVTIADTGIGGTVGEGPGHGLIGIRERVAVGGGHVVAGPGETGGFVVNARLPYGVSS